MINTANNNTILHSNILVLDSLINKTSSLLRMHQSLSSSSSLSLNNMAQNNHNTHPQQLPNHDVNENSTFPPLFPSSTTNSTTTHPTGGTAEDDSDFANYVTVSFLFLILGILLFASFCAARKRRKMKTLLNRLRRKSDEQVERPFSRISNSRSATPSYHSLSSSRSPSRNSSRIPMRMYSWDSSKSVPCSPRMLRPESSLNRSLPLCFKSDHNGAESPLTDSISGDSSKEVPTFSGLSTDVKNGELSSKPV